MRQAAAQTQRARDDTEDGGRRCAATRVHRPKDQLIRFVLAPDGTVDLTATGSFSDGTDSDVTGAAVWASLAPEVCA